MIWILASFVVGFVLAVHLAREEMGVRLDQIDRLKALLAEKQIKEIEAKIKQHREHDDGFVDRSDPDWWKGA
jgi:phage-related protein